MNILFLTTVLPGGKRMGSEVASQVIIDALFESGHKLSIVGFERKHEVYKAGPGEITAGPRDIETSQAGINKYLWLIKSFVTHTPYSITKYKSSTYTGIIKRLTSETQFDIVIIDHVQMSWILKILPPDVPVVGVAHNVEHKMYASFAKAETSTFHSRMLTREGYLLANIEERFLQSLDHLWVFTANDAEYFRSIKSKAISIITLPANSVSNKSGGEKEFDIGLVGSWSWAANEEGLRWFFNDIYPCLPEDFSIQIAGSGAQWLENMYKNVTYLGFVDDVQEFLEKARVVAIPTLSGGGIQIKTLDAIASGSSIVATELALRGIDDAPETVNVANSAEEFVSQLVKIVRDSCNPAVSLAAKNWAIARKKRLVSELDECATELVKSSKLSD